MIESFENDFWRPYDKKVGKDKCITKWALISPSDHLKIKIHVPGFVASKRNKQYRPNPLSYLNGKMWLDEGINEEDKILLSKPKEQKLSDYEPKPFDRAEGIAHIRKKLKQSFEEKIYIQDWGGVYTSILLQNCGFDIPASIDQELMDKVKHEATRKRNRSEEPYRGSINSDFRDARLNWWLSQVREQGIKVYEKI